MQSDFLTTIAYKTQAYLSNSVPFSQVVLPLVLLSSPNVLPNHRRIEVSLKYTTQWQWCYSDSNCTASQSTNFNAFTSDTISVFVLSITGPVSNVIDILPPIFANNTLFTPSDLVSRNTTLPNASRWPSVSEMINLGKRMVLVFSNNSYNSTASDILYVFNSTQLPSTQNTIPLSSQNLKSIPLSTDLTELICSNIVSNETPDQSSIISKFPAIIESSTNPFTQKNFQNTLQCGYTPITPKNFQSTWFWDIGQPTNTSLLDCTIIQRNGRFRNVNCLDAYPYSCKNQT